jgi:GLPGLI family protein
MKYFITLSLILIYFQAKAQDEKSLFVAKYKYAVVPDLEQPSSVYHEDMMLIIGKSSSLFKSYEKYKRDSLIAKQNSLDLSLFSTARPITEDEILKLYNSEKGYSSKKIGLQYYWEDSMPIYQWVITNDTATIAGYKCQKATTFSEKTKRNYTAWFTSDIPFPTGPLNMAGLPGLIIKLDDSLKSLSMELYSFQKANADTPAVSFGNKAIKTTRADFDKALLAYKNNPLQFLKNSGGLSGSVNGATTSSQP